MIEDGERAEGDEPELEDEDTELDAELDAEIRELITMLDREIGRRWMSLALRLQIEKIELMIGERGTFPSSY